MDKKKFLHIDYETYSNTDLTKTNATKYCADKAFEILLACYSLDGGPVETLDFASAKPLEKQILKNKLRELLIDPNIIKTAHNATFEMTCSLHWLNVPFKPEEWLCTLNMVYIMNLPGKLGNVSQVLGLSGKMAEGKDLIKYFCCPCKPTKVNGGRTRNLPEHAPEKWKVFKDYCVQDVIAEMEVYDKISWVWDELPEWEKQVCFLDYKLNHQGIKVDLGFIQKAYEADEVFKARIRERIQFMTQLENPNSLVQLKKWIKEADPSLEITSLDKDHVGDIIEKTNHQFVKVVLTIRQLLAKTSTSKYPFVLGCHVNGYMHNLLAYMATITGRWAGRGAQVHNLPRNKLDDINYTRKKYLSGDFEPYSETIPYELSQLLRTMFIPENGNLFVIMDYSAIEARIVAWLAGEQWVLDEFAGEGKIYEAMAARMFNINKNEVDSYQRQDGKTAVLACGYGGGVGAIQKFTRDWTDEKCQNIVDLYRAANPRIVKFWRKIEDMCKEVIQHNKRLKYTIPGETSDIQVFLKGGFLVIQLPSGRRLYYPNPSVDIGKLGFDSIYYWSQNQTTRKWEATETYGGKLTENIVQAIARDLLAIALLRLDKKEYTIRMHIHDEIVVEIRDVDEFQNIWEFDEIKNIMALKEDMPQWCTKLPLDAEGLIAPYYQKG